MFNQRQQEVLRITTSIMVSSNVILDKITNIMRNYIFSVWLIEDESRIKWLKEEYLIPTITTLLLQHAGINRKTMELHKDVVAKVILNIADPIIKTRGRHFVEEMFADDSFKHQFNAESTALINKYVIYSSHVFGIFETLKDNTSSQKQRQFLELLNKKRLTYLGHHFGFEKQIESCHELDLTKLLKLTRLYNLGKYFTVPLYVFLYNTPIFALYYLLPHHLPLWTILILPLIVTMLLIKSVGEYLSHTILTQHEKITSDIPHLTILHSLLQSINSLNNPVVLNDNQLVKQKKFTREPDPQAIPQFLNEAVSSTSYRKSAAEKAIDEKVAEQLSVVAKKFAEIAPNRYEWRFFENNTKEQKSVIYPSLNLAYVIFQLWTCDPTKKHLNDLHFVLWHFETVLEMFSKHMAFYDEFFRIASIKHIAKHENEPGYIWCEDYVEDTSFKIKPPIHSEAGKYRLFLNEVSKTHDLESQTDKILHVPRKLEKTHYGHH